MCTPCRTDGILGRELKVRQWVYELTLTTRAGLLALFLFVLDGQCPFCQNLDFPRNPSSTPSSLQEEAEAALKSARITLHNVAYIDHVVIRNLWFLLPGHSLCLFIPCACCNNIWPGITHCHLLLAVPGTVTPRRKRLMRVTSQLAV